MKTSNKILLGGLLTIVLVLLAVDVAIYARYKAGNYIPYSEKQSEEASYTTTFENAHRIKIQYLQNVVVRVGDQLKVEHFGGDKSNIAISEKYGTVTLTLKDSTTNERLYEYVIVYIPESSDITTYRAQVAIEGEKGKAIKNLHLSASGGLVAFQRYTSLVEIENLNLEATGDATVEFQDARIDKLSAQLNTSELIDKKAEINQLELHADSTSRVSLQSKNLLKLITKTTANE